VFTGIVQGSFPVLRIADRAGTRTLTVALPDGLRDGLAVGASVALAGVCLTVTGFDAEGVTFDAIRETQDRTTIGGLREGDRVNVERSARAGDEIGGHEVSGHVDGTAEIAAVDREPGRHVLTFRAPRALLRYVFPKGFIALDGCSLTVVDVDRGAAPRGAPGAAAAADSAAAGAAGSFTVHFIPETLRVTTFGERRPGDRVNLEIERRTQVIVDTVREVVREALRSGELSLVTGEAAAARR
jgi:riboflavin synthase